MEYCDSCSLMLRVLKSYNEVTGDSSPDTPTEVYGCMEMVCQNPKCDKAGKVQKTLRTRIYPNETAAVSIRTALMCECGKKLAELTDGVVSRVLPDMRAHAEYAENRVIFTCPTCGKTREADTE